MAAYVASYALDIKPSARKELERLSDNLIARIAPKIEALAADPNNTALALATAGRSPAERSATLLSWNTCV